ncbi:class I SAM-dependent methyltransferase [Aeromonas bestiarum]|uniref:class I SAM-dependent methyltransferase n=1 Tax=Aeromonas bestiarum TaxID=105751 RepID=UPI0011AF74AD|nr:class I SAM-dependent methyltransferase [Aeromonas bestiarum]
MFIDENDFFSSIKAKKIYLSPYNDLSLKLNSKMSEQYHCIVSGYIDAKKESTNIYRSSVLKTDDVVIISSPAYWNEIVQDMLHAKVYLNTKHGFVEYQEYKLSIANKKYSELSIRLLDQNDIPLVNEILSRLRNKFYSIAIVSNNQLPFEGEFIGWEENSLKSRECFFSLSINSMVHESSVSNLSVLLSKSRAEPLIVKPNRNNISYTNVISFDGTYPLRNTLAKDEAACIGHSSVDVPTAAHVIDKDICILTSSPSYKYIDLVDSSKYGIPYNYLSPNKYYHYNDLEETDNWQLEVYLFALGLMIKHNFSNIADIGCGSAYKLVTYFKGYNTLGIELPENVAALRKRYPDRTWLETDFIPRNEFSSDVIIFSDVIEHLLNPDDALEYIKKQNFTYLILSTPAKDFLYEKDDPFFYGPPKNPAHQREWTMNEFSNYIGKHFNIIEHRLSNYKQSTQMLICEKK